MIHLEQKLTRLKEIASEMDYIYSTYQGCDWCCGGGDEELADLESEVEEICLWLEESTGGKLQRWDRENIGCIAYTDVMCEKITAMLSDCKNVI